jgi:predicted DNA-binding protein (MmcQ/YjbR family)
MIDLESAHEILTSMPEATEDAHFDKPSYKIKGKIFATFNIDNKWVTLRLTPEQQTIFCEDSSFYPVPNKWGQLGWTHVDLNLVKKSAFTEGVITAYNNIVSQKNVKKRR